MNNNIGNLWENSLYLLSNNDTNMVNENQLELFTFEDFRQAEESQMFWYASELMVLLGYKEMKSFQKAIDKAIKTCLTLSIPYYENFIVWQTQDEEGNPMHDYKLTRFACYLIAMNADNKKPEVAAAQLYFIEQTRKLEVLIESQDDFERLLIREELKDGNKSLFSAAKEAGVEDYAKFVNAGYMGMYNMYNFKLAQKRKIPVKELIEYMGRTELAANLFRVTQTEERIKNFEVKGQQMLEQTHHDVGKDVRNMVKKNTGKNPEMLEVESKVDNTNKELKKGYKKMLKLDK